MTDEIRRVLVVEDEPLIRMLAVDILGALGFAVAEAASAAEALAAGPASLGRLHAAMIDLGLPDMPGDELAATLLKQRPDLPVILTSGVDADESVGRLRALGVVRFLEKPYQSKDVQRALEQAAAAV